MDADRARELLKDERDLVEGELAKLRGEGTEESDERVEPGEADSESLYQDEFDAGRIEELKDRLASVERAEARLEAGNYGVSIKSGEPIPDERLELQPTAELNVDEAP